MNKFRIAALGAALVIAVSAQAQAQTAGEGRGGQRGAAMRDVAQSALFQGIELTDAQKTQVRTIGEKYAAQRQEMRRAAAGGADGARQRRDSATVAKGRELVQKQQDELRGVLTADQQKVFDKNVTEMRNRPRGGQGQASGRDGRPRGRAGRVGRGL